MRVVRSTSILAIGLFLLVMQSCIDRDTGIDSAAQLEADKQTIDSYLVQNGITAQKDKSGVRFKITELGTKGFPARTDQTIKAKYVGKFLDGTVFDPGTNPVTGVLSTFISGWQVAFTILPPGTKATIWIPSPLAYGSQSRGSIPPNSILVFDIEFVEVQYTNAEKQRLTSDINAIDAFLADKNIDAVEDTTGVRYVITTPSSGAHPDRFTKVKFSAVGKNLTTGNQFYSGTSEPNDYFDSRVADFIHGLQVGLLNLGKGGKMTVYIPSGLAFGPYENTSTSLPANSNVIYEIELIDILD